MRFLLFHLLSSLHHKPTHGKWNLKQLGNESSRFVTVKYSHLQASFLCYFVVQALLSFAAAQQQAVGKMDIVHESSASSASAAIVSSVAATSLPTSQPLLDPRSSTLTRLGALPPISRGSRPVLDNSASHSLSIDCARPIPPPAPFCEISGSGFGSKMDPLELHKRKQHLESLRDQIRLREQQERRQALADNAIAPSSASVSDAQLQQRRELAERLRSL